MPKQSIEIIENKAEELSKIAVWLEMRGAPEYNLYTTLAILERKIKRLRKLIGASGNCRPRKEKQCQD